MRVAAAAGVPFGGDQHVLAERGQLMAAERTPVRRGLAVRRASNRPPWGRRKARGHRPIVAPLASALAVVGVGVAVALAKGQLERRAERAKGSPPRRPPSRRPALIPGEPYAEGLRRVIFGQLTLAVELLEAYPDGVSTPRSGSGGRGSTGGHSQGPRSGDGEGAGDPAQGGARTVHETRKALKRLRALLMLLRPELGAKRYARENAALRDCGRRLAGARDAEVMLGTLDSLVQRDPSHFTRSAAVRTLRAQLLAERDTAAAHAIDDPRVRGEVVIELRAVRARVERWELRERGFRLLAPGLEDIYARGRRRMRAARRRQSVEALHAWRKRVKELRYAAETLDRGGKAAQAGAPRRSPRRPARGTARRGARPRAARSAGARALAHVRGRAQGAQAPARLIAARRRKLRKRALREGERLYRRPPRRFVRRVKRAR